MTQAELQHLTQTGQLAGRDLVWCGRLGKWTPARRVAELAGPADGSPPPSSDRYWVVRGALNGIALPFRAAFVLGVWLVFAVVIDMGLNALLGTSNRRLDDALTPDLLPDISWLRLFFVVVLAVFGLIFGALVGSMLPGGGWVVLGVFVGYLAGSMTAGAVLEWTEIRRGG